MKIRSKTARVILLTFFMIITYAALLLALIEIMVVRFEHKSFSGGGMEYIVFFSTALTTVVSIIMNTCLVNIKSWRNRALIILLRLSRVSSQILHY